MDYSFLIGVHQVDTAPDSAGVEAQKQVDPLLIYRHISSRIALRLISCSRLVVRERPTNRISSFRLPPI